MAESAFSLSPWGSLGTRDLTLASVPPASLPASYNPCGSRLDFPSPPSSPQLPQTLFPQPGLCDPHIYSPIFPLAGTRWE